MTTIQMAWQISFVDQGILESLQTMNQSRKMNMSDIWNNLLNLVIAGHVLQTQNIHELTMMDWMTTD